MDRQLAYREGMTVFGADGDKVGKVVAVDPSYIVVEKGFFFPTDYYIPTSAVATMADDDIYLNVSKDEALNRGWDQPLAAPVTDYAPTGVDTTIDTTGYRDRGGTFEHTDTGRIDEHDSGRERVRGDNQTVQGTERFQGDDSTRGATS